MLLEAPMDLSECGFVGRLEAGDDPIAEFLRTRHHGEESSPLDDCVLDHDLIPESEIQILQEFLSSELHDPGPSAAPAASGDTGALAAPTFTGSVAHNEVGSSVHGPSKTYHGAGLAFQALYGHDNSGFRASFEDHARARAGTVHGGSLLGPSVSTMSLGQSIKPTMRIALPNVHAHLHPPGPAHPLHHALSVPAGGQASARHSAHDNPVDLPSALTHPFASSFHEETVRGGVGAAFAAPSPQSAGASNSNAVKAKGGVRRGGRPTVASASRPRRDSLAAGVTAQAGDKLYHPQMEKARRDRINRLLNELRVLVPPGPDQVCGGQDKRAKHVVLQDTIALLKALLARNPGAASGSGQSNGATCVAGGGGSTGGATQSPEGSAGNAQLVCSSYEYSGEYGPQ